MFRKEQARTEGTQNRLKIEKVSVVMTHYPKALSSVVAGGYNVSISKKDK